MHFLFGDLGLGGDVWGFIECWRGDFVVCLLRKQLLSPAWNTRKKFPKTGGWGDKFYIIIILYLLFENRSMIFKKRLLGEVLKFYLHFLRWIIEKLQLFINCKPLHFFVNLLKSSDNLLQLHNPSLNLQFDSKVSLIKKI